MSKQTAIANVNKRYQEDREQGITHEHYSTVDTARQMLEDYQRRQQEREEEERKRRQERLNERSARAAMDIARNAGEFLAERRERETEPVMTTRRAAGANLLTPAMEAEYQRRNGANRAPNAYQTYMMQVANSQPRQEETRSTDELRRDMNRQNRLANATNRMAADMGNQALNNQGLIFDPVYTSNLRTMGQTMEAQQAKAAAATSLYQTVSTQRRAEEEREKYASLMQNPDFAAKSQGDPTIGNKVSATALSPAERLYVSIYNHGGEKTNAKDRNAAEFVSDEEAGIFFYLWNTQGPRAAQAYYNDYVNNRASQRRAEEAQAQAEAFGHRDILGSSAESVVANFASGVGLVDMAWQNIARSVGLTDKNKPLNYYSSAQLPGLVSDAIRKGAADELAEKFPKLKIGKGENAVNVASFLYETGMSMADSSVAILLNRIGIPETATLANMGAAAGTRAIRDARERGASDGQALAFGISSAVMEGLFEKVSLDSILKESNAHNLAQSILGTLKQGFTEGSEEVMTTLANTAADMFIMGDKAEVFAMQRRLMEQGVSEKEALGAAFQQWGTGILGDAIGGFLSGAGMGGVKEFSGARNNPLYRWNMPMAEARALQGIEQNGLPQERGITPELQANIDAAIRAQNEREMAQDRAMLAQDAARRQEAAQRRATPPLPQQAAQITPESVTTPPVPGDAQRGAEGTGADTNGQERTEEAPHPALRATFSQGKAETEERNGPPVPQRAGEESQTLGIPPVPGLGADETGRNNSGENRLRIPENSQNMQNPGDNSQEARLRIAPLPERENPGSGLRIGNRPQQEKAQRRQLQMESQTAESLRNRGFENAGEDATVYVRSEDQWDAEERAIAERLRQGGTEPTFVTGLLQNAEGQKVSFLRYGDQLALQTDNRRESLSSIVNRATGITITEKEGNRIGQAENPAAAVGQQAERGEAAPVAAEARDQLFDGGRGRLLENGAGEQAGSQRNETLRQIDRAGRRRSQKENIERVSVGSLGIRGERENSEVRVLRESGWDEELRTTAQAVERATGCKVSYVLDGIRLPNGVRARGVYTGDRIIIQADHNSVSVKKLAAHEAYHAFASADTGLNARIRERIIEQGKGGKLDETLRTYVAKLAATVGLSEDMDQQSYEAAINRLLEEIFADAYAGLNAYGAEAGQFMAEAREAVGAARSAENDAATERRTGPPEKYSAEKNTDAEYMAAAESGDMETAQRMVDEAAKAAGYTIHAYHGTGRADRVGNVFRADRATSGPMAFFTDSKDIAENYSRDKRDTSLAYDTDYDSYETQFRAKHTKTGKDFAIYKMWGYIPLSERAKIKEKARHVRANWEGEGEIIYDPQATEANGGWSYQLQEFKGDVLKALNEQWLNSGNLFNEEEQYLKVLELAGVTDALKKAGFEMPRYMNPDYREEAVYDVFLKIQNPFDATSMIDEDFIQGFEDFAVDNEERFTKESVDADYWDKNSVSAEEFAERMRNDLERGVTHAWTSIPDVMSEYLKSLGYDGIKDAGGKNGGQGHTVWIPFTSEQIKRTDPVTYDDAGNIIPLSKRFNPENEDIRYSAEEEIPQSVAAQVAKAAEPEAQTLGSREILDTPALKKLGVKVSGSVGDYGKTESLIAKDRAAKSIRKEAVRAERRLKATDAEKDFANGITAGIYREEDIPARLNKNTVMELADYYWAVNSANLQTLHQLRADINQGLRDEAEGFLAEADIKPISMIELNERTPERAFRKMFGEKAQGITKWLLDPVRENEAEKIRWYNQQMDAVRKFTDSKGKNRELTRAESALTMRLMEGRAAADMVAGMETKAAIENAAQNIRKGGDAADAAREFSLSGEERDLAEKYAGWLDTQEELKTADSTIVEAAAKKYAELFDDYYNAINDFLVAHGYEPIGYIKGYAPHMQPEENQSLLEKAFEKMGINAAVSELPASIAGQTAFFKPNKRWNPYFLQRNGSEANYDIVKAYQSYVDYMADILYHTDDIMRVRQTANWIRQTYAPEDIREKLDWAQELRNAPTEDKQRLLRDAGKIGQSTVLSAVDTTKAMQEYIDGLYEQIGNSTKNSNLVMWLDNYANILAGKQSFADRGWEYSTGRKSLNLANKLNNTFQKANVAGNLSSIPNQMAQLPMIYAELGERDFLKAVADLANRNTKVWAQDSDFLTAKEGKELLYTDNADKFVSALFAPAGFMDQLVSTVAVRGAFNKAIRQGASYAEAMQKADAFGQAVMGSRAKGSRPLAYDSKGFFSKMVHMFQIEAVNSWDHLVSDLPREIRSIAKKDGKGKAAMALAGLILRALIGAFTLNRLTDELYGGTPAPFDVLGLTANFVASGKGLSTNAYIRTIIDNTMEKMGHERLFGTEAMTKEDFDLEAAADDLLYNVMNDVPLMRNAAGVLGLGDQTVPLPGAGGEFKNLGTAVKNMLKEGVEPGEVENLVRAIFLAATQFIPGGRQISKTAQGVEAIIRGGSYSSYKNPKLQYPLEDGDDFVKALLFGKNATNAAKEYWAAGGNALTEKQTALYTALASHGVGRKDAYDAIQRYREIANDDSMTSYERGKAERALLAGLGISDEDKLDMYRELNNAESKAAKFRAIMETGLSFDQVMTIQDKYAEIDGKEGLKAGDKAKEFYLWVDNQSYTAKQKTEIKNQIKYFQSIPAEAARYDKLTASGLSPDMSAKIDQAIGKLEPEAGKTDVSDYQKWRAALNAVAGEENQKKALKALMTEDQYAKFEAAKVSPGIYVDYKEFANKTSSTRENGKEVKGETRKDKLVVYIDGLKISSAEKDSLFLLEYKESGLSDTPWHKGGGKGSGSYAPARIPTLRIPAAPTVSKPGSGLRIRGTESGPARQSSGLRIRAAAPAAQPARSGLRIKAQ